MKAIFFDLDGVIFKNFRFWRKLHEVMGTEEKGRELTQRYLLPDYDRLVSEVMKLWRGKDARPYFELIEQLEYVTGVKETMKKLSIPKIIISGSSLDCVKRAQKELRIDLGFGNEIEIENGKFTGGFIDHVGAGYEKKAEIVKEVCKKHSIRPDETAFIGDGESEIDAFRIVGLPIAFSPENEAVSLQAKYTIHSGDLKDILKYLKN